MSSVLAGGPGAGAGTQSPPSTPPFPPGTTRPLPPHSRKGKGPEQRGNAVTVIAGVGVLLVAMGVGVLIGRAGAPEQVAAPAQVITVGAAGAGGQGTGSSAASFTDDWPAGKTGYTVQLQTLPQSGTQVSAVEAAKTAATAKGATGVGALKSEDFSSVTAGNYVIYSGVYTKRPEAVSALGKLKKSFPGASVIGVSNGGAGSSPGGGGSSSGGGSGTPSHPAPPTVLKNLRKGGGKSYVEKSKNLPNVIETG